MGNPDYELLEQWCAFCEEAADFDEYHFSSLLMELFYDFGDTEAEFIKQCCKYFGNGRQLARLLCRAGSEFQSLTERQIKGRLRKFTKADIEQKLPLLRKERQRRLARTIEALPITYVAYDLVEMHREESELDADYKHHVDNALALPKDPMEFEMSEAVYNALDNDTEFQQIFDTFMVEEAESLTHALELWLMHGEYVITDDEVLVAVRKSEPE